MKTVSASFTRPANTTAYASGDLVANDTTAGNVVPMTFGGARPGKIIRAKVRKSGTGVTNAAFRVHLFMGAAIVAANGDNGVLSLSGAANYIGAFDITASQAFTDGSFGTGVPVSGQGVHFVTEGGGPLFGILECRGAYTPANAEVFTVSLDVDD